MNQSALYLMERRGGGLVLPVRLLRVGLPGVGVWYLSITSVCESELCLPSGSLACVCEPTCV